MRRVELLPSSSNLELVDGNSYQANSSEIIFDDSNSDGDNNEI